MIELHVEDYCHKCGQIEPIANAMIRMIGGGEAFTEITCEHAERCAAIASAIRGSLPPDSDGGCDGEGK